MELFPAAQCAARLFCSGKSQRQELCAPKATADAPTLTHPGTRSCPFHYCTTSLQWHGAGRPTLSFLAAQADLYLARWSCRSERGSAGSQPRDRRARPGPAPRAPSAPGTAGMPRFVLVTPKLKRRKQDLFLNKAVVRGIPLSVVLSIIWTESANRCGPVSL